MSPYSGKQDPMEFDPPVRILVTVMVLALAIISLLVFTTTGLYGALDDALTRGALRLGLGFSVGAVLVLVMLMVVSVSALSVRRLKAVLYLSTALFIPSALYFSHIDPFMIMGFPNDLSHLGSSLPDMIVFLNGAAIVCGLIFLRSYHQIRTLGTSLIRRGASLDDVIIATRSNLGANLMTIIISLVIVTIIQVVIELLSDTGFTADIPLLAAITLALASLLAISFLLQIGSGRSAPETDGGWEESGDRIP